jgi:hypothetical protein
LTSLISDRPFLSLACAMKEPYPLTISTHEFILNGPRSMLSCHYTEQGVSYWVTVWLLVIPIT